VGVGVLNGIAVGTASLDWSVSFQATQAGVPSRALVEVAPDTAFPAFRVENTGSSLLTLLLPSLPLPATVARCGAFLVCSLVARSAPTACVCVCVCVCVCL
jgi:hypothetical protein